ncbi:thioredoxin family protein [Robiginitalea sp. IMCC44478]|uniref:thioredoxin family protein n=1 Tax=Robiginitalea sp. IMCC44478 TaxID=3459122 RepID=UPI004043403C
MNRSLYAPIILLLSIILINCKAQPKNTAVRQPDGNSQILVGTANIDSLLTRPFAGWFVPNLEDYQPNPEKIEALEPLLEDVDILLFMGTWCKDSKREVPRFVKILQEADYPVEKVRVIMMTRDKTTPQNYEKGYGITNVPTIIFSREGTEINRIVEYPLEDMETDMLKILSGQAYRHAYDWD